MALHSPVDSMPGSLRSSGESISAIFSPPSVSGSNPRSPCRHHPRRCNAVQPFRGLRGVQYHLSCNDSWPGISLLWLSEWCAQPLSNFTVADGLRTLRYGKRVSDGSRLGIYIILCSDLALRMRWQ